MEGGSHARIQGEEEGKSRCKGPEVGVYFVCLRNRRWLVGPEVGEGRGCGGKEGERNIGQDHIGPRGPQEGL